MAVAFNINEDNYLYFFLIKLFKLFNMKLDLLILIYRILQISTKGSEIIRTIFIFKQNRDMNSSHSSV